MRIIAATFVVSMFVFFAGIGPAVAVIAPVAKPPVKTVVADTSRIVISDSAIVIRHDTIKTVFKDTAVVIKRDTLRGIKLDTIKIKRVK